jgi:hypothetical protein
VRTTGRPSKTPTITMDLHHIFRSVHQEKPGGEVGPLNRGLNLSRQNSQTMGGVGRALYSTNLSKTHQR